MSAPMSSPTSRRSRSESGTSTAKRKSESFGGPEQRERGVPVVAKFVPLPNIAGPESNILSALVAAADKDRNFGAFDNEVVKALIEFKWQAFVRGRFMWALTRNLMMIAMFTADVGFIQPHIGQSPWYHFIPMVICVYLWGWFTWHEWCQFISARKESLRRKEVLKRRTRSTDDWRKWLKYSKAGQWAWFLMKHFVLDGWNFLDFASLGLIQFTYMFRLCSYFSREHTWQGWGDEETWIHRVKVVSSLATVVAYGNLLYYMQGFPGAGKLVRMISGILSGIMTFVVVMIIILLGFR